jgi:hypothetical protein
MFVTELEGLFSFSQNTLTVPETEVSESNLHHFTQLFKSQLNQQTAGINGVLPSTFMLIYLSCSYSVRYDDVQGVSCVLTSAVEDGRWSRSSYLRLTQGGKGAVPIVRRQGHENEERFPRCRKFNPDRRVFILILSFCLHGVQFRSFFVNCPRSNSLGYKIKRDIFSNYAFLFDNIAALCF